MPIYKNPADLANHIIQDEEVPNESNEERLKEGGLVGRFERAGHKVSDVTDNSLVVDGIYKVVGNNNLGFDVFKGDEKVAHDIGNQRNFIALLEKLGGK